MASIENQSTVVIENERASRQLEPDPFYNSSRPYENNGKTDSANL